MVERRRGTLLFFAAIAAVMLSLGGFIAFRYYDGKQLLNDVEQTGNVFLETEPLRPEWLRTRLADHSRPFERIVGARIGEWGEDPARPRGRRSVRIEAGPWIDRLSKVRTLRTLDLRSNRTVTDEDIGRLAATMPPDLEKLELSRTDIGDESLKAISEIPNLKELSLSLTFVTERGIDTLRVTRPDMKIVADPFTRRGLGRVRRNLYPDGDRHVVHGFSVPADMTVVEAERVGRIPSPIWIGVVNPVQDGVIQTLARQPNIDSLALFSHEVTMDDLAMFASLTRLKKLTMYSAHLDDQKLAAACEITSLKELWLLGEADMALAGKIRERRSDLAVHFEPRDGVGYRFSYRYKPKSSGGE
ncbi:MAG: hypothetical protein M3552_06820 [Planctomycetota bacterium]|nr:hypothetical protein [Planctomycetota bacterium]